MRITWAVASLLLLAFILGIEAGKKCANCGLGEGNDPCNCGNTAVRAQKLAKPEFFASPEVIKKALKLKSNKQQQSCSVPPASYSVTGSVPISPYSVSLSPYSAAISASASPYSIPPSITLLSPTLSSPFSKSFVETTYKNDSDSYGNYLKSCKNNEDLKNLLKLPPGTSIAPKFEPIGDLCHSCKGYKNFNDKEGGSNVIGVIPARPGKLPCKCPNTKPTAKSTTTPARSTAFPTPASVPTVGYSAPAPVYSAPTPFYTITVPPYSDPTPSYSDPVLSNSAPTPFYSGPELSYSAQAPPNGASELFYSAPTPFYSVAESSYSTPTLLNSASQPFYSAFTASAQYAPAYQTPAPASCLPPPPSLTPIIAPEAAPTLSQYASTYQQPAPIIYAAAPLLSDEMPSPQPVGNWKDKNNAKTISESTLTLAQYAPAYQESTPVIYLAESPSPTKKSYKKSKLQPEYDAKIKQNVPINIPALYDSKYQQAALINNMSVPPGTKTPCEKSDPRPNHDKNEQEAQTYVEIVLQKEQTPKYTADPISISLAYKNLADSQGKKYIPEDTLAYGHYKDPADGRVDKRVSCFDEEKLHTVDKPVVELKYGSNNQQKLQVSYSDIGYGPVAPSKNRFVPKTDNANISTYGPTIVYVPPLEDKDNLPCGSLGPTIPGYKPGSVIVSDNSNAKPTCGRCGKTSIVQEGSRQAVLLGCKCNSKNESEEYDSEVSSTKGGIIKRIKSSACKSG